MHKAATFISEALYILRVKQLNLTAQRIGILFLRKKNLKSD